MPERRFDARDFGHAADSIIEEWQRRKTARKDRERHWKEIDRQIAMEPECSFKKLPNGKTDVKKLWMAEMELPLQAQALEVLTADARRMMFPDTGPWFRAHAEVTDAYLDRVDFESFVLGDENDVPSRITQDNADKLVEGFLLHQFRQYDHAGRWDRINAESFKYGMGVGRSRSETKSVFIHEAMGTRKAKQRIPVIAPCSIKNLYLDDPMPSMHSAQVLGPAHIAEDWIKLANLQVAANKGSNDPDDEDGGWMPAAVKSLEPDKNGFVQVLEFEGDLIIPRKTVRDVVIPGVIVTVAKGAATEGGKVSRAVIRLRYRKKPYSSYILCPYHYEGSDDIYPIGPLMKGRPVQMMATDALNRLMDSAMLKNAPPVGYDRSDQLFSQDGGPEIYPYATWETNDPDAIKVFDEIGGDPAALSNTLSLAINLYAELTGILPARLGAQTKSHTTAFSKDAELTRGAVRTVDYVRATGQASVARWLDMAYDSARDAMDGPASFYSEAYGGFIEVSKGSLPDKVSFEWFGSGGPTEEQARKQARLASLQLAVQLDQLAQQSPSSTIDFGAAIREVLKEGMWIDVDSITRLENAPDGAAAAPGVPGAAGGNPGAATAALQALAFGAGRG